MNREKNDGLNADEKILATEKQQELENMPTEESEENKEVAPNEPEEKEEDKVSFSLHT